MNRARFWLLLWVTPYLLLRVTPYLLLRVTPYLLLRVTHYLLLWVTPYLLLWVTPYHSGRLYIYEVLVFISFYNVNYKNTVKVDVCAL